MAQFRRAHKAITKSGQIKRNGGHHEKDDRSRIGDRSQYVLGWANQRKIDALVARATVLVGEIAQAGGAITLHTTTRDAAIERGKVLSGLAQTTEQCVQFAQQPQDDSRRIYTDHEYRGLGTEAIGFISFLENSGVLPGVLREIVIDRAQATNESPISLQKIKIIALMVLWSQEAEIDHLVLEELLTDDHSRPSH